MICHKLLSQSLSIEIQCLPLRLIEACAKTSDRHDSLLDTKVNKYFRILWNYQYRFAYCPIPKTGSTTWMFILFDLVPWLDPGKRWELKVILLPKPLTLVIYIGSSTNHFLA